MRRRFEESFIREGMDPIQARKESIEVMNNLARNSKKDFDKRVNEEAKRIEERLIREGADPDEAFRRARREAKEHIRDLDRPKPYRPGSRSSRPPRPRANPDPMALFMGCAIVGMNSPPWPSSSTSCWP